MLKRLWKVNLNMRKQTDLKVGGYKMQIPTYTLSITDVDIFDDVLELLKKACDKDPELLEELAKIMSRYDDVYEYSVKK